jgi:hypothetical protein
MVQMHQKRSKMDRVPSGIWSISAEGWPQRAKDRGGSACCSFDLRLESAYA